VKKGELRPRKIKKRSADGTAKDWDLVPFHDPPNSAAERDQAQGRSHSYTTPSPAGDAGEELGGIPGPGEWCSGGGSWIRG
jgi:hypothetical protein